MRLEVTKRKRVTMGNLGEEIEERVKLENKLAYISREVWGDNAVEMLVGAISSISTESQLSALISHLTKEMK